MHRGASLTYGDLDARANGIAARLQQLEIGRGGVVAVAMTRGLDWMVAMLGIFRARAAYMPLDPRHPPARLADIVRRADCRLVLGHAASETSVRQGGLANHLAAKVKLLEMGSGDRIAGMVTELEAILNAAIEQAGRRSDYQKGRRTRGMRWHPAVRMTCTFISQTHSSLRKIRCRKRTNAEPANTPR